MSSSLFVFRLSLFLIHLLVSVFISFFSLSRSAWFSFSPGFLLSLSLSLSLFLPLSHALSLSLSSFRSFLFLWVAFSFFSPLGVILVISLSFLSILLFLTRCCSFFPLSFLFVLSLSVSPSLSLRRAPLFTSPFASWGLFPRGAVGVALLISLKY